MSTFHARWVLPIVSEPLENGWVQCQGGQVSAVGSGLTDSERIDLGDVAIIPGLVNAHTHLEFSDLTSPLGEGAHCFTDWIRAVIQYRGTGRATGNISQIVSEIGHGLEQSNQGGVAAVGEITTVDGLDDVYNSYGGVLLSLREFICLSEEDVPAQLELAQRHIQLGSRQGWNAGLSPHAPYSVHGELLAGLCKLSAMHQVPLAMHLAETEAELTLLQTTDGSFRALLEELGVWDVAGVQSPGMLLDYLQMLAQSWRATVVHGNYLTDGEWQFIANHRDSLTVAFCPRTHAYFRHRPYPLPRAHELGVRIALGTDSRASNPDLSMITEVGSVRKSYPQLAADELMTMATLHGAYALGMENRVGMIAPGALARLLVVPCDGHGDIYDQVIDNLAYSQWLHL